MKKICLIYPNTMQLPESFRVATNISTGNRKTLPPLGMLYIIGNSKYEIDFIDNRVKRYGFEKIYNILSEYDIIGFGGTIFEIEEAKKLSHALLEQEKSTIYGGPNATVNWEKYLGDFSVIFRGEAEEVFDEIIEHIDDPGDLGFTRRDGTYFNLTPYRVEDLDKLQYPSRNMIDAEDYKRVVDVYLKGVYPVDIVSSSRGCPYDCYFCSSKIIWGRKYNCRSVDNVIEEIKYLMNTYGTRGIYFREDNFTVGRDRLAEFCRKVKALNISWMCESRVDTLDEEIILSMSDSGCRGIWFGIESMDREAQKKIGKNIDLDKAGRIVAFCRKQSIVVGGGFMLGFTFDDKDSIIKNYNDSKKIGLDIRFYNRVWAIPKSEMYDEIIAHNIDRYEYRDILLPGTKYLSAKEVNDLYFKLVSGKERIGKILSGLIGEKRMENIKKKFPFLQKLGVKLLRK